MTSEMARSGHVFRALIPVAGRGTRMYPATAAIPKELLAIGNRPLLEFTLDELVVAGITEAVLVTARGKHAIEDFVDDWCERHPDALCVSYVRQREPRGLGGAVLCGEHLLDDGAFAVVLPDDLLVGRESTLRRLIDTYTRTHTLALAVEPIMPERSHCYGVPKVVRADSNGYVINGVVENPAPGSVPSMLGVVGRYVLPPRIFGFLRALESGEKGEIRLTDAIDAMAARYSAYAVELVQQRIDCGSPAGLLEAQIRAGATQAPVQSAHDALAFTERNAAVDAGIAVHDIHRAQAVIGEPAKFARPASDNGVAR
jgi:UTP--glucose-1-phosphate uridylyltransferase